MPITEKLSELLQKRSKLHDEAREMIERCDVEKRSMSKDEETRHLAICGTAKDQGGELFDLDKRIAQMQRVQALERNGDDPRSGSDPFAFEGRRSPPLAHEDPTNTRNAKYRYSILKACRDMMSGGLTGLEKEVSDEIASRTGTSFGIGGFKMPHHDVTLTFRDVDKRKKVDEMRAKGEILSFEEIARQRTERRAGIFDSGAAAGSIQTTLDTDWIDILRNSIQVMAAGAKEITNLVGKFAIPRQNQAATSYWVAESAAPTASNQTVDQVLFSPRTIGAYTDISRRSFELSNIGNAEDFVRGDLTAVLARGVDLAALNGTGASSQPLGILQNTGITSTRTVALGTNGLAPTWPPLVELFTIVARGNANGLGEFSYMGNADVQGTLATTAKIGSTFPVYLLADDTTIYGKRFLATQQLPNNLTKGASGATLSPLIGGVWNQLILAYWSGVDIIVDPYTGSNTGAVRIVALQDCDIQVRHNEAFSVIVDMITNQSQ